MNERQKRFREVYDYLRKAHGIFYHKDLALAIGTSRATISAALSGNEAYLTNNLLHKIYNKYPGEFNLDYLLYGEGTLLKKKEPILEPEPEPVKQIKEIPATSLAAGVEHLLNLAAQGIKENETLRAELSSTIKELRAVIDATRIDMRGLMSEFHRTMIDYRQALDSRQYPTAPSISVKVSEPTQDIDNFSKMKKEK